MNLPETLLAASAALAELSAARCDAQREPRAFWRDSPSVRQQRRKEALAEVTATRALAVAHLRAAQVLFAAEPPLPATAPGAPTWEWPEWPRVSRGQLPVDGPADLADFVEAAVESWDDDDGYARALRQWVREYALILGEAKETASMVREVVACAG